MEGRRDLVWERPTIVLTRLDFGGQLPEGFDGSERPEIVRVPLPMVNPAEHLKRAGQVGLKGGLRLVPPVEQ